MPWKPKQPCAYPGCGKLTDRRYCEAHKKIVDRNYNKYTRPDDTGAKYGRSWRKVRDLYIRCNPLCEMCLQNGVYVNAKEVHHKIPVSRGGTNDEDNIISLCLSCHRKITHEMGDR